MVDSVDKMIDALQERDFLVFVGAGIPKPTGVEDWKGLLLALNELAPVRGVDIEKLHPKHYPEIAQMIYVTLEDEERVDEYYSTVEKVLEPSECRWHSVQWKIACACNSIVTTNLDCTLEYVLTDRLSDRETNITCKYQTLGGGLKPEDVLKSNHITYLHGRRGEHEIVLKTANYEKHYASLNGAYKSDVAKFLGDMFCGGISIIFVGFSFRDRYVLRTFERVLEEMRRKAKRGDAGAEQVLRNMRHFALMDHVMDEALRKHLQCGGGDNASPESPEAIGLDMLREAQALEARLKKINVEVIRYEHGKHKELENIFERVKISKASSKTDTSVTKNF